MQTKQDLQREPTIFSSRLISLLVAILLFIALLYRQNDLALLTLLILLLMLSSKIWSRMSLAKVFCAIRPDRERLFPGESLSISTTVKNAKFLPVWVKVNWPQTRILGIQSDLPDVRQEVGLLWYQQAEFKQKLTARKRGCYNVGPSHIATSDVFGFFKAEKPQPQHLEIVVYPRITALKPVSLPKRDLFGTPGSQSPVKDPVYIIGTQDYQPSRPARHIHWKASARQLKLQEKVFEPSEQGRVLLILDVASFEQNQAENAFESTLEVIAALILRLDQMNLAVGFLTNATLKGSSQTSIPTGRGSLHLAGILEMLGRLQLSYRDKLKTIIHQNHVTQRGAIWAYFCHQQDKTYKDVQRYCQSTSAPLVPFTWDRKSTSEKNQHPTSSDVYCIPELRSKNLEQI
jgi:uncharacterized protein (DUF58 family)